MALAFNNRGFGPSTDAGDFPSARMNGRGRSLIRQRTKLPYGYRRFIRVSRTLLSETGRRREN